MAAMHASCPVFFRGCGFGGGEQKIFGGKIDHGTYSYVGDLSMKDIITYC